MREMRLGDLVGQDLAGQLTEGDLALDVVGLTADSRRVEPGYLFAALPGTRADGAQFIPEALARGARVILAEPKARACSPPQTLFLPDRNPRLRFARLAARFYAPQPKTIVAVTGTNGKTSVVGFVRQIWAQLGFKAASIGTLGLISDVLSVDFGLTTPDPVQLHKLLTDLKTGGVEHVAMEASSHGLSQYRLDGVALTAGAITNLTRDHLDYHGTFERYAYAKLRLVGELLPPGSLVVINADAAIAAEAEALAWARGHRVMMVGHSGRDIRLAQSTPRGTGQHLVVICEGQTFEIDFPLAGPFQASNALVAAALVIGTGSPCGRVFAALSAVTGAPGRLSFVGQTRAGAAVYVDYAHTPDALETVLKALRPHTRGRLHVVFGCGGDRDPGKRPEMGRIAALLADHVIVTDDNPRSEEPSLIRQAILAAAPGAVEIADRAEAIGAAIAALGPQDVLIVAGKGHETGQIVGTTAKPFSDMVEIRRVIEAEGSAP